jgi:cyclic beta-1,2-glucan synthetase
LTLSGVETQNSSPREPGTPGVSQPNTAILGAAPFTTIISNAGGGETRYGSIVVNRWRSDPTLDDHGVWCYIRDVTTGRLWSAAHQPVCAKASSYRVLFDGDCATFHRRDGEIETKMEILVSPESATEARKITLTNRSDHPREIELTSYGEIVIAPAFADRGHPAFQSLFVQTEWIAGSNAILAMRRPRSAAAKPVWCGHVLAVSSAVGSVTCETDRARFVGRGRSTRNAIAMDNDGELSGRTGAVLDPVFSIRVRLAVPAGGSAEATFFTFVSENREHAMRIADIYHRPAQAAHALEAFRAEAAMTRESLGISGDEEALYQQLAAQLVYPSRALDEAPVMIASVQLLDGIADVRELAKAHRYLARKGIDFDLTVLAHGQKLAEELAAEMTSDNGRVSVVRSDSIDSSELAELMSSARVRVDCDGSGTWQFGSDERGIESPTYSARPADSSQPADGSGLSFFNGTGGFNSENEYEIRLTGSILPPAPWINVIGNPSGGFIVSETGAGATWIGSGSSFRLSPWHNDPVGDRPGECIYLKDEESGSLWCPTAAPIRESTSYRIRHGTGYSTFEHEHDGIATTLRVAMAERDPVKLQVLELRNTGDRTRRLTCAAYVEWVLGTSRESTRFDVEAEYDGASEVMTAVNPFDPDLPAMTAFFAISEPVTGRTISRRDFIGRNGSLAAPAGLVRGSHLQEHDTKDPCAALISSIELAPGETKSIAIILGAAEGRDAAMGILARYRGASAANAAIDSAVAAWRKTLGAIAVQTPDPAFDLMLNQWALYQALSCRVWGRNALYQSSGAFGFRDQLQDVMALTYAEPALTREQIVRAASRQFEEGDVQHWWHPHSGRGLRTRFADDLVWLPFVIDHYIQVTGDKSVLDERTPYLKGRLLEDDEDELYMLPEQSDMSATAFDHCVHILNRAATAGAHGLPLIGSGDWNDGMNRVGVGGRGESVWLAWFLAATLRSFSVYADARGYQASAVSFRRKANAYVAAVERTSWDGEWYRRAYYDDGAPLGSHVNTECQIDSIAQSWSVISKAGDAERSRTAMASLHKHLVREDAGLIMLLTPAFDRGTHDPGYIQGYLPGVRENGAQYTHAALWAVMATAMLGDGDHAMKLYRMINPVTHAMTPEDVDTYKVEPYVVAADVYTAEGHVGRGGWTWYTGSASWMYRVGLESILGFSKRGDAIEIDPCIPASWKEFSLAYRFGRSVYRVLVQNPSGVQRGVASVLLDGDRCEGMIPLVDDGAEHSVLVTLG